MATANKASDSDTREDPPVLPPQEPVERWNDNGPLVNRPRINPSNEWNDNGQPTFEFNDNGPPEGYRPTKPAPEGKE